MDFPFLRISIFASFFFLTGCSESTTSKPPPLNLENAQEITLLGEDIVLNLPNLLKRSSRYSLANDIPALRQDSLALYLIQNMLEGLEFEDSEIDVFVDTTSSFHTLVILNVAYMPFDKNIGAMLNKSIRENYEQIESNLGYVRFEKMESTIKRRSTLQSMKFKYKISNLADQSVHYRTIYFMSNDRRSFVIYEDAAEEEDFEEFLWTIKG